MDSTGHGKILTTAKLFVGSLVPGAINIFPNLLQLTRTPPIEDSPITRREIIWHDSNKYFNKEYN